MLAPSPTGDAMQREGDSSTRSAVPNAEGKKPETTRATPRSSRWVAVGAALVLLGLIAGSVALVTPHVRAWYHLRAARTEVRAWHNAQAIRHLKICIEVWPRDPDVLLLAARSARRTRAYAEVERLLELYQQQRGLDEACSLEQLLLSAERGNDPVVDLCWRYIEQGHPDTPLILEALALGYLRQYRLAEARMCLDRWRELQPENAHVYCLDGLFHLDYAHAQSAAIESFSRAVELDGEHEEARQGLAVALLSNRSFTEAIPHLQFLHKRQPDSLSIQVGLAEAYDNLGKEDEATRLLDDVLGRQSEFAPALALRGRIAMKNGQAKEAEHWLREAVRINPVEHRARYSLIQCLTQNGKDEEAQQTRQQFAQLEEDLTQFNEIATRDIVKNPRDPALHCKLGQLLLRTGQSEEGLRWLRSALRLDPQYAPARQAIEALKEKAKTPASSSASPAPSR